MDLDTFIVAVYCAIDEELRVLAGRERWRTRGPRPRLADSEVLTIEVVGEFLGIDTDRGLYAYFRRHYGAWFPALRRVHRTTFARQAANLWAIKERLWQRLRYRIDTVFGQLVDRYRAKRVWARDAWHLWSRLLRKVLSHTLAVHFTARDSHPPLHHADLILA